jgi:ATP-dependent Zn protease
MSVPSDASAATAGSNKSSWRGVIFLFLFVVALLAVYAYLKHPDKNVETLSQTQLFYLIREGRVQNIVNQQDPSSGMRHLVGWYTKPTDAASNTPAINVSFSVPVDLQFDPHLLDELKEAGYTQPIDTAYNSDIVWPLVINFLPIVVFVALMYFLFRQGIKRAALLKNQAPPPPAQ